MAVLRDIAGHFSSNVVGLESLGNGLINDTFLVQTASKPFVLQKINRQVFPHPELIMLNLIQLNQYLVLKDAATTLTIPALIETRDGEMSIVDPHGDYWRAWSYVENTDCLEVFRDSSEADAVGLALGQFHRLCYGLNAEKFQDTLPGFHIAPQYYYHYQQVKSLSEVKESAECRNFIEQHGGMINDLEAAKAQKLLTVRVIHGDPKLNNFLFDKTSKNVVSLIDLDTVKPGLIHYDIGDCLRSCCHNLTDNSFNMAICNALLSGYIAEMAELLTSHDYDYIYSATRLIPFELGLRFYTDYLDGNRYFKVVEPEQNLKRALNQFQLCASVIDQETGIKDVVRRIQANHK